MKKILVVVLFFLIFLSSPKTSTASEYSLFRYEKNTTENSIITHSIDGNLLDFLKANTLYYNDPRLTLYGTEALETLIKLPKYHLNFNPSFNFSIQSDNYTKVMEDASFNTQNFVNLSRTSFTNNSDSNFSNCEIQSLGNYLYRVDCSSYSTPLKQIENTVTDLALEDKEMPKFATIVIGGFYSGEMNDYITKKLNEIKEIAINNNIRLFIQQHSLNNDSSENFYNELYKLALGTNGDYQVNMRELPGVINGRTSSETHIQSFRNLITLLDRQIKYNLNKNTISGIRNVDKIAQRDYSQSDSQSFVSDPIDTSTGALIADKNLFTFGGNSPLSLDLTYNSLLLKKSHIGYGWSHNFEEEIKAVSEDSIEYYSNPNSKSFLHRNEENKFVPTNIHKQIKKVIKNESGYQLFLKDNSSKIFNLEGKLIEVIGKSSILKLTYSSGLLEKVEEFAITGTSNGKFLTFTYDETGLLVNVKNNDAAEASLSYDASQNLIKVIDSNMNSSIFVYDSSHRIIKGLDNEGITYMNNEYDESSRVVKQFDSYNNFTTLSYIENFTVGQLTTTVTNRQGETRKLVHDLNYNLIELRNELGHVTNYEYDERNNRTTETDSNGSKTVMEYDTMDNLISVTNPKDQTTVMDYDLNKNLTKVINSRGEFISNQYDENSQLVSTTDLRGNTTSFIYTNGLVTQKTEPDNRITLYEYTNGNLTTLNDPEGNATTYSYDALGNNIETTDPNGNTTKYRYDKRNNQIETLNPMEKLALKTYDSHNEVSSFTDFKGIVENYTYDDNGSLISSLRGQQENQFEYDKETRLVKSLTPKGHFSAVTYDSLGQVIEEVNEEKIKTTYTYDKVGNVITKTVGESTFTYEYDKLNNLISETDSNGNKISYSYNDLNQKVEEIDPKGNKTTFKYDALGNLISQTDALGNTVSYEYDKHKNIIKSTDAKGFSNVFEYDKNNRLVKSVNALGQATSYSYDKNGNLIQSFDSLGNVTTREYDSLNRLIKVTDPLGHSRRTEYDELGNIIATYDAKGNKVSAITYDDYNNPTTLTDATGHILSNTYDNENNLIEIIDELNRTSKQSHNALGAVVSTIDANEVESASTYNDFGDVSSFVDPNENQTTYLYDKLGQVLKETNAAGNELTYQYDEIGNLTSYKNGRQQEATLEYDEVGNLVKKTDIDSTIEYGYDANYNLTSVTETKGEEIRTTLREYDELNRIIKYTDEFGNTIQYKYDIVGNVSKVIYPDGKEVTYTYDVAGNLKTVTDWNNDTTSYTYDENDLLIETLLPNGTSELREYDIKGQLISLTHKKSNGETIKQDSFTYDAVGNVLSESGKNYEYDSLNRLIKADNSHYAYDNGGNLLSVGKSETDTLEGDLPAELQLSSLYTYGLDNQLTTYNEMTADFDADGNLLNIPSGVQILNGVYDSRNRLTALGDTLYQYNAENKRISVTENGEETRFVINPHSPLDQVLMETDAAGVPTAYYVYGMGLISKEEVNGEKVYYHFDRRGSTIALTDSIESITDTYEYDVYGEILQRTNSTENRFLYNGKYGVQTDASGMYYMRARHYNPEIKRFINRDILQGSILEPQTFNRYAYVNGNPVSFIDPFGLSREEDSKSNLLAKTFNFFIGDDLNKLMDPNASALERAFAGVSLVSNFVPGGVALKGIKVTSKAISKASKKAYNFLKEDSGNFAPLAGRIETKSNIKDDDIGAFSIYDWSGYPESLPKPKGPFKLLEGEEYAVARKLANKENAKIHRNRPDLYKIDIHEVHPVKFGGSPTEHSNKIPLIRQDHSPFTTWFNNLGRTLKDKP